MDLRSVVGGSARGPPLARGDTPSHTRMCGPDVRDAEHIRDVQKHSTRINQDVQCSRRAGGVSNVAVRANSEKHL
jgi:hypothetical protein